MDKVSVVANKRLIAGFINWRTAEFFGRSCLRGAILAVVERSFREQVCSRLGHRKHAHVAFGQALPEGEGFFAAGGAPTLRRCRRMCGGK